MAEHKAATTSFNGASAECNADATQLASSIGLTSATFGTYSPMTPGAFGVVINAVAEGYDFYQRIGRQIEVREVHVDGCITQSTYANNTPPVDVFLGLVWATSSSNLNFSSMFVNAFMNEVGSIPSPTSTDPTGLIPNLNQRDQFHLLWGEHFAMQGVAGNDVAPYNVFNVSRTIKIPAKYARTVFGGSTGQDIATGALVFVRVSSAQQADAANAGFYGNVRCVFIDP